jgi:hypothetical protein
MASTEQMCAVYTALSGSSAAHHRTALRSTVPFNPIGMETQLLTDGSSARGEAEPLPQPRL